MHTSIRLVRDSFGEYQPVSHRASNRLLAQGVTRLEGVDGDEEANTVTYYYEENIER